MRLSQPVPGAAGRAAVRDATRTLTAAELERRIRGLAAALRAQGVVPDDIVGLYLPRTVDLVVAIHAVLRAGAAYLPLDPTHPAERVGYVLGDARPRLLVTDRTLLAAARTHGLPTLDVTAVVEPADDPGRRAAGADDAAYVLYTSGSTGRPKGVVVTRGNVEVLLHHLRETFTDDELAVVAAPTPATFDLSVPELLLPVLAGTELLLLPSAFDLVGLSDTEGVTFTQLVPSVAAQLVRMGRLPATLRTVVACGEPLSRDVVAALYRTTQIRRLVNAYGPTETTVYVSGYDVPRDLATAPTVGRPYTGVTLTVRDEELREVDDGEVGELVIAGPWLARGYLHQPELTAARFPRLPGGDRGYLSGDLARRLPDGAYELLGRRDQQVKVHGQRIELGEIEEQLRAVGGVAEAAVVCDREADGRLVGFVVGPPDDDAAAATRAALRRTLPGHMVPAYVFATDALPLTGSGKLDRAALVSRSREHVARAREALVERRRPSGPPASVEDVVGRCVADVLQLGDLPGRDVDLFDELGLSSLAAVELRVQLDRALGSLVALQDLLDHATVARLAALLAGQGVDSPTQVVELRRGSAGTLALFAGWFGQALGYRRLATALAADLDLTVLAVCPQLVDDENGFAVTMPQLAARGVRLLDEHGVTGPLVVGGHSLGGAIAYEVARALAAEGRAPAQVALLDTDAPPRGLHRLTTRLTNRVAGAVRRSGRTPRQLVRLLHADHVAAGPGGISDLAGASGDEPMRALLGMNDLANELVARSWHAGRYDGPVHLVWTDEWQARTGGRHLGWDGYLAAPPTTARVAAEHLTLLSGDHVHEVAEALTGALAPILPAALDPRG